MVPSALYLPRPILHTFLLPSLSSFVSICQLAAAGQEMRRCASLALGNGRPDRREVGARHYDKIACLPCLALHAHRHPWPCDDARRAFISEHEAGRKVIPKRPAGLLRAGKLLQPLPSSLLSSAVTA